MLKDIEYALFSQVSYLKLSDSEIKLLTEIVEEEKNG